MNFKKVNQNISIDDFINGAEETTKPTLKPKELSLPKRSKRHPYEITCST